MVLIVLSNTFYIFWKYKYFIHKWVYNYTGVSKGE